MNDSIPTSLAASLERITAAELSPVARLGHVVLMLVAAAMTILVASLLLTEPALPTRTSAAFTVLVAMGLCWTTYAGWALTHRRGLLANLRVVAGRMAVTFTAVFVLGSLGLAIATGKTSLFLAAGLGAAMLLVAVGLLVRAKRHFALLQARREALEDELRKQGE